MRSRYTITEERIPMTPKAGEVVQPKNTIVKRQRPDILKDVIDLEQGNEIVTLSIPVYEWMHNQGMTDEEIFKQVSDLQEAA